ncbi:MAG: MarR family transcriptional regulator [Vulcanimicrobiaceae bacterium]
MPQPTKPHSAPSAGARAWELMYEVFKSSKPYMESVAGAFDLTPQQLFALKNLSVERPMMMSELATTLGCDASNVTSIVDRLEARRLVERRSADHDRRVKALVITSEGLEVRDRIHDRMQQPPPALDNLSVADQEALCALLTRALAAIGAPGDDEASTASK